MRSEVLFGALYMLFGLYMRYIVGFGFFKSIFNAAVLLVIVYLGLWYLNNTVVFYRAKKKLSAFLYFLGVMFFSALFVSVLVYSKRLI